MENEIGKRIREMRLRKGMTQKEVAGRCGMADSAIRKYESGRITPKTETIKKIASALGTDPLYLQEGIALAEGIEKIRSAASGAIETIDNIKQSREDAERVLKKALLESYNRLNLNGKEKAVEQVGDLAKVPDYQKEQTSPEGK